MKPSFELCPEFQWRGAGFPSLWPGRVVSDPEMDYDSRYHAEVEALRGLYQSERLQEALWWQNPPFAKNTLPALLRGDCLHDSSKSRRRLRKFVSYLQRYCAKNEVIGFFGPVGFGNLVEGLKAPKESDGDWLQQRRVYLEPWVIRVLWYHFTTRVPEHALLYLSPKVRVRGGLIFDGSRSRRADGGRAITSEMSELLDLLRERPRSLAELLAEDHQEATIDLARRKGWVSALPAIPSDGSALIWARNQADCYHPSIRDPILQELAHYESLLKRMSQERSGLAPLPQIIWEFQELLASRNSGDSSRNKGSFYGGRLGFYEDCRRRPLDVPADWLNPLLPALFLVLRSARWMALRTASRAEQLFAERADRLQLRMGDGFPAVFLWERTRDIFSEPAKFLFQDAKAELAERWRQVLGEQTPNKGVCRWSSEELSAGVERFFPEQQFSYRGARFHSCDLLFTSQGKAVLGELHPCLFPFQDLSTTLQHPDLGKLRHWYEDRSPGKEVRPATFVPFTRLHLDGRIDKEAQAVLVDPHHGSWRPLDRQIRLGDVTVHKVGENFMLRGPGEMEVGLLDFFTPDLCELQHLHFSPFDWAEPGLRLEIDEMVVHRAKWRLQASQLSGLKPLPVAERLTGLNRILTENELPEQFFAHFPKEVKPLLIMRDSVLFLELFWSLLSSSGECTCSEVLPALEEAWLETPDGPATSEGRFVFFDRSFRTRPLDR